MKKVALFLLFSILLLRGASTEPLQPRSTETATSFVATTTTFPTSTNEVVFHETVIAPTTEPTSTPTPTPTPNPYEFGEVDLSTGDLLIEFANGGLAGIVVKAQLISPANLGGYENTSEGLALGNETGVARPEKYGNILVGLHSGYYHNQSLEAESLRFYFERWGKQDDKYVVNKLLSAIGSHGTISINGNPVEIEVVGVVRMEHSASEDIQLYPEEILDTVTGEEFQKLGDTIIFGTAKSSESHFIMINFCGWGPNQEPTYYRYVILMKISTENNATPLAFE